jgi:tetratricopeptide (TPR) repeat protein
MRRVRWRRLLGIICLCLLPRLSLADAAQARVHFERGRTFFEVDEYRKAIAEFKAAHIEKPDPAFLYNIAECHRRLGEVADALVFYRRFLATAPPGDKTRALVEQRIAELKAIAEDSKLAPPDAAPTGAGPGVSADAGGNEGLALNAPPPSGGSAAVVLERPAPAPAAQARPFYTRPWFIATVGVVLVASAIGIWALSQTPEPPATALGNQSVF